MSWAAQWWTFAVGAAVVFLPGAIAALIVGLRGFSVAAAAAPLSLAVIGAASLVDVILPFEWAATSWAIAVGALLLAAIIVGLLLRRRRTEPWPESASPRSWQTWLPFAAAAIAASLLITRLLWVLGDPQNISQTFDDIYHLGAVRHILDTGHIAPTRQLFPGFYPSLWHGLTATVVLLSGSDIPTAVNVVSVLLGAIVWPLSCVYLTRQIVGSSTPALLAAGALSAGLGAFPLLMLDFGVLYPNVLSIALLPAVLGALVTVTGLGEGPLPPQPVRWLLLLAWVPTLALAHPSTLMAFFAIGIWPALAGGTRWLLRARATGVPRRRIAIGLSLWAGGLAVAAALLLLARPTRDQAFWGPSTTPWQALTHILLDGLVFRPFDFTASALMLTGIVAILVRYRRRWWLVAGWGTLAVIYIVCASIPRGLIRYGLTGTWYSDLFRIGALLPVVIVPLGAIGFAVIVAGVVRLAIRRRGEPRLASGIASGIGTVIVVCLMQYGAPLAGATEAARSMYVMSPDSPLLTTSERDLIRRLPEHVATDEVIVGSPWTGTSLSYALADRQALLPHIYADLDAERPPDVALVLAALNEADADPEVCEAVDRLNARWVLDFGAAEIHGGTHAYPGLDGLVERGLAELVDSEGPDARLYRITACD